ncbi:MAG: hypothetical protein C0501_19670 [Isosphaera sp.]|nr:hypothetical protein [Isosphaera sp.]
MIRVVGHAPPLHVEMEEVVLPPEEHAGALARRERYFKNMRWFEAHIAEIRKQHAGQSVCVAGETLFAGPDPREVFARARAAFPDDWGSFFTMYLRPDG